MSILYDPEDEVRKSHSSSRSRRPHDNYQSETAIKYDNLLVFGYECKLFRDDELAESVNKGETLIPWMGDKTLLIDRYDCRGYLYHIEEFDFSNTALNKSFTPEELEIERICDEERYMSLNKDMITEDILKEEEEKRTNNLYNPHTAYQTIEYSYNDETSKGKLQLNSPFNQYCHYYGYDKEDPNVKAYFLSLQSYDYERPPPPPEPTSAQTPVATFQKALDKFVPPEGLKIPAGMEVPETQKMQSILEKTALFISKQGTQMEIVLKAKQAGNAQFDFLSFGNWLNPYYKFILEKIKSGEYKVIEEEKPDVNEKGKKLELSQDDSHTSDDNSDNENELHPLLQAHRRPLNKTATTSTSITNYVPKSKPTGKIEDLAKIYMSMKYKPEKEEEKESTDAAPVDKKVVDSEPEPLPIVPYTENNFFPGYPGYPSELVQQGEMLCPPMPHMMNNIPMMLGPPPPSYNIFTTHNINPLMQPPLSYGFPPPNFSTVPPQSATISRPPKLIFDISTDKSLPEPIHTTTPELPRPSGLLRAPGPLLPPQVMPLYRTSLIATEDSDDSLQPPGVELDSNRECKSNLPPPPPLPPPPTIEDIKKKAASSIYQAESVINKISAVENTFNTENHSTIDEYTEDADTIKNENSVNQEYEKFDSKIFSSKDRYKPSSLLAQILNSTINQHKDVSSSLVLDRLYHGESETDNFNNPHIVKLEQSYNSQSDFNDFNLNSQQKNVQKNFREGSPASPQNDDLLNYKEGKSPSQDVPRSILKKVSSDICSANDLFLNSNFPLAGNSYISSQSSLIIQPPINITPSNFDKSFLSEPCSSDLLNTYTPTTDKSPSLLTPLLQKQTKLEENHSLKHFSTQKMYTNVIIPPPDLQPVIDRLALYVAKNGDEFEEGIKLKEDPRFDFLNSWNIYNKYYTQQKNMKKVEIQKQKEEDEERKRNMKVSFGLKTKLKPVNKTTSKIQTTTVFNQNEEEDEESVKTDGFKPNKDKENEIKRKHMKQDYDRGRSNELSFQQRMGDINRLANVKSTPQQIAQAKRFTQAANLRESQQKMQEERKKKAASFVGKLKNTTDNVPDSPPAKKTDMKKDAFFEAINQAFKGI